MQRSIAPASRSSLRPGHVLVNWKRQGQYIALAAASAVARLVRHWRCHPTSAWRRVGPVRNEIIRCNPADTPVGRDDLGPEVPIGIVLGASQLDQGPVR